MHDLKQENLCWLWYREEWLRAEGVPATDRGFRHGISVFESLAIYGSRCVFLEEHLAKLRQAAHRLGLRIPPDDLAASTARLLADFSTVTSGMARIYITAGDGGFDSPLDQGRIVLMIEEQSPANNDCIRIRTHPGRFASPWPGLKTGNYWDHVQAWREAQQTGFAEAVLINPGGHVVSATLGNLFAVIDGLLMTPRPASGARIGVIRDWVTDRRDVVLSDFHPEQLKEATEIFLTNSGQGIRKVSHLDGRVLPQMGLGQSLQAEYAAMLERVY